MKKNATERRRERIKGNKRGERRERKKGRERESRKTKEERTEKEGVQREKRGIRKKKKKKRKKRYDFFIASGFLIKANSVCQKACDNFCIPRVKMQKIEKFAKSIFCIREGKIQFQIAPA